MNRIKELLKEKGWSAYKLHQETGLTSNAIYSLVNSECIPDGTAYSTLKKVAKTLGVKIDDLENRED